MPNIKAATKWMRQTEKRTERNLDVKSRLKTIYKKAAKAGDEERVRAVGSQFDKAASKGIIHPNKAARKKSRLAKAARTASTPVKKGVRSAKKVSAAKKSVRKTSAKKSSK
ncbi:MAG: hypothetical protein NVS1B14_04420 [Vulcanimicrobiaceae bacterium]